ncbi:Flavin-containing monooxygenase YUCCA3 [Mycena sanguinolenta]|uniref:Flavin-containing monooxygenase YUCCA3 n=1 Tax=Mycena sanguinolenta TaxID=230812 RepID=A0A8H6ZB83_9AGAR|nr:Flavin-containing monooxygenase YUCCA3 [Mycena sanguinolenta]
MSRSIYRLRSLLQYSCLPASPTMQIFPLPRLNATIPPDLDVDKVAKDWMAAFVKSIEAADVEGTMALFNADSVHWRDMLALTWDFRTFHGATSISTFLTDRLPIVKPSNFRIKEQSLQPLAPDLTWICITFDFDTHIGAASGIVRLVPQTTGAWKAYLMYTNLEQLTGFPEKIGDLRHSAADRGTWSQDRANGLEFVEGDPVVLIIGAGHSGLDLAARLKYLDIRTLVIEKNPRIGDNWRNRYDALCLHDPVWYDHMPYMPLVELYAALRRLLANWLEHYADSLELDVWTSSTVTNARPNAAGSWDVIIDRAGKDRVFKVKHVVFATGFGGGAANFPSYPGMDIFKGEMLHSTQQKRALDHTGKRVVVIGACTSAHDIAADYASHGVDVTMYQRGSTYVMSTENGLVSLMRPTYWEGGPPTDVADRNSASLPFFAVGELHQRRTAGIAQADKKLLDGLHARGFRTNLGIMDTGIGLLAYERAGGYYPDVGASQMLIDGKIKLKNDSQIASFTPTGLKFDDGSELSADVVVFATGLGDARGTVREVCGDAVADRCKRIWGLNAEGEVNGAWRDLGVPGLWYMMGNLQLARFHSKHVALRMCFCFYSFLDHIAGADFGEEIKAMEEGLFGERYAAVDQKYGDRVQ